MIPSQSFQSFRLSKLRASRFIVQEKRSGTVRIVTIGNFDGMHLGHQALTGAVNEAKDRDLSSALVTFHLIHRKYIPADRSAYLHPQLQNRLLKIQESMKSM